jgi:hypothetical protein
MAANVCYESDIEGIIRRGEYRGIRWHNFSIVQLPWKSMVVNHSSALENQICLHMGKKADHLLSNLDHERGNLDPGPDLTCNHCRRPDRKSRNLRTLSGIPLVAPMYFLLIYPGGFFALTAGWPNSKRVVFFSVFWYSEITSQSSHEN